MISSKYSHINIQNVYNRHCGHIRWIFSSSVGIVREVVIDIIVTNLVFQPILLKPFFKSLGNLRTKTFTVHPVD